MQKGIQLSLFVGPVPIPAPRELVEALTSVKVENGSGDTQSGFELTFDLPVRSPLRTLFLISGGGGGVPLMRVALVAAVNGAAEPLIDGSQVIVPGPATAPDGTASESVPSGDGRIHLNRATAAELDDLPGIGPVIAERIVAHRSEHGPFRAVEDLLDVPGIGEAKLATLRDLVVP